MRQALVPVVAWSLATGAAVTLSWWGVHSVMAGTAYDPPRAVPIAAGATSPPPPPLVPATRRPRSPSATPAGSHAPGRHGTSVPSRKPSPSSPAPSPSATGGQGSGTVKSYEIAGGRAVFDVSADAASLVSATPDAGWRMQTWTQPEWVRVTFTKGRRESSVFYTWNGHAPAVAFDSR
ncbi:hypothetical protein [Streptomyces montanisoli]|uniref:Secreted protein n=1 Tax=Streptomyces montanisoli TaxID=2798581 RepID=A0A940MI19_9ACTN|nr:hypothetical protein [Streptomyces montanisoli]MBP0461462.1 hypothetical protein [Streptomyces montanisoli]